MTAHPAGREDLLVLGLIFLGGGIAPFVFGRLFDAAARFRYRLLGAAAMRSAPCAGIASCAGCSAPSSSSPAR